MGQRTLSHARAHDQPIFQIEDRDNLHARRRLLGIAKSVA
jgi:hypothetical protein